MSPTSCLGAERADESLPRVTITAWDKGESRAQALPATRSLTFASPGIDYFTAQQPAEGRRWCDLAIRLAKTAKSPILPKVSISDAAQRCSRVS